MKQKGLIILCVIFAGLLGLIYFKKSIQPKVPTAEEISEIIQSSITKDNVNGMIVQLGDGEASEEGLANYVHLVKEDSRWILKSQYGARASETAVTPVLEKLDVLKGELRSNKEDILADYGITEDQAVHVVLFRMDAEPIHVFVGTKKAGAQNNFVRLKGSNAVYVVNENILGILGLQGEGDSQKLNTNKWIDKRIMQLDTNNVVGMSFIEFVDGVEKRVVDVKLDLSDDTKQWQSAIPYEFGLSASQIKSVMNTFNNTYSSEVIAPDVEGVFDAPGWIGTFTMDNGEAIKLVRGAKDSAGTNYYFKLEGSSYYNLIPVSTFHSRKDQQGNIFTNNPLKVESNTVEAIDLHVVSSNKKFHVIKKQVKPEISAAGNEATNEAEVKVVEDVWETPKGEPVDKAKVDEIIDKIKLITIEAALQPSVSVKDSLVVRITKEGVTTEYAVSDDIILETGKECRFLRVSPNNQSYCASKSTITALQNALP